MSITALDGKRFAEMVIQGANHLGANAKMVDALNVFPVPDGDTGTNMNLSMTSGAKEVKNNLQEHIGNVGIALIQGVTDGCSGKFRCHPFPIIPWFCKSDRNQIADYREGICPGIISRS